LLFGTLANLEERSPNIAGMRFTTVPAMVEVHDLREWRRSQAEED